MSIFSSDADKEKVEKCGDDFELFNPSKYGLRNELGQVEPQEDRNASSSHIDGNRSISNENLAVAVDGSGKHNRSNEIITVYLIYCRTRRGEKIAGGFIPRVAKCYN